MEFSDIIKYQTSVHDFTDKEVEEEKITYILEYAHQAPSYMNAQYWRFIVIKSTETISLLAKTSLFNRWFKRAPLLIIACMDPTENHTSNNIKHSIIDSTIALEHLILAATNIGLATCWIEEFNEEEIKKLLEIPKRIHILALIPLGYSLGNKGRIQSITSTLSKNKKKRTLDELIHYEHW